MKKIFAILLCTKIVVISFSQNKKTDNTPNLIIITTDGFRWQELYNGIDTSIANNKKFNEDDSIGIYNKYTTQPIMPFVTNYISKNGQLWGNRNFGNNCSVKNPYWFSYPGYSELFCGFADDSINSNQYKNNPNLTLLDYLQTQKNYKNKIAAFGAWFAFDRILNETRAGFPVFNAFDIYKNNKSKNENLLNKLNNEAYKPWDNEECLDVMTHNMAMDYLKTQLPKALFIGYGETDEWSHSGKYKSYLNAATQVDGFIKEIWNFVQSNKNYKDNTIILITTDHGRGNNEKWISHNNKTPQSNETWFAIMGKGVAANGLQTKVTSVYQAQLAQTIAHLLGLQFTANHYVETPINLQ